MKTCLVTGGAGFIGSHLCRSLLGKGYRVICIDNLCTGSRENVNGLEGDFEFLEHDVKEEIKISGPVDFIFHLASRASPLDFAKYPLDILLTNSIGTYNVLNIAKEKGARFLLASTSEVYGDPLQHPQRETYFGNVNSLGPRSCYDESKRFAESLAMNFRLKFGVDVRVARIFNSILADQPVVVFNDNDFHLTEIGEYVDKIESEQDINRRILVPAFDMNTCKISLYEVSNVIKHPYIGDAYEIRASYGRKVKVTGDHSVFTMDKNLMPVAIPVRNLKVGDYIALPTKLPAIEKEFNCVTISDVLLKGCSDAELWDYALQSDSLKGIISKNKNRIYDILEKNKRYKYGRRNFYNIHRWFMRQSLLPLSIIKELGVKIPIDAKLRMFKSGAHIYIPNRLKITDDILWLIGFYLAEGSSNYTEGKNYFITFSSDNYLLEKAKKILENNFGVHVIKREPEKGRAPAIFIHSKVLYFVFDKMFKIIGNSDRGGLRIPSWVFQLPLSKLKYFLEGFREGDGTHSGKQMGNELCFNTKYEKLALDLTMLLLRFGIVASVGEYSTTFKKKYGNKRFKFYRVTICKLSNFDILQWDKGVRQKLTARTKGDIVWAKIKEIKKCKSTNYVYDFSVPGAENFMAGNGVCCHNTFGPSMRANDGRVIPNFINQALKGEPITIYGDGRQTRSFCYVSDLVGGLEKLMFSEAGEVVFNLGNPSEISILEVAKLVMELTKSDSEIVFRDLPENDPARRRPDISKARNILKWELKVDIRDGLLKTIEYFRKS